MVKSKSIYTQILQSIVFSLLVLISYILFFGQFDVLFIGAFICERLYTLGSYDDFENSILNLGNDEVNTKMIALFAILMLLIIGIFISLLFINPLLILVLILGEIIDKFLLKVFKGRRDK